MALVVKGKGAHPRRIAKTKLEGYQRGVFANVQTTGILPTVRMTPTELTFAAVDGLGFAAEAGSLAATHKTAPYVVSGLGPLFEFLFIETEGKLPPPPRGSWLTQSGITPLMKALREERQSWIDIGCRIGFMRAVRTGVNADAVLTKFLMDAKRAAVRVSCLSTNVAGQMAAAMGELHSNIHEHSEAASTGVVAFHAESGVFEFVAADGGIGVLRSLKRATRFAALANHGKALEMAVADGNSRFENSSMRGYGFRPIFIGLMNLYGSLRFRSGDYALLMDGTSPGPATAQIAQKPFVQGFVVSVRCYAGQASRNE